MNFRVGYGRWLGAWGLLFASTWWAARILGAEGVTPLSPAGPIVAALLLLLRCDDDRGRVLAGGAAVCAAAHLAAGTPFGVGLALVAVDVTTGGLLAAFLRRLARDAMPASSLSRALGALLLAGMSAGSLNVLVGPTPALDPPHVAAAIGAWLVGLAVFTVPTWAGATPRQPVSLLIIAVVTAAAAALTFSQDTHPLAFTLIPLGVAAAWWRHAIGATVATIAAGAVTAMLTFTGAGPIAVLYPAPAEQVVAWQLLLLTIALTAHASAILLRARDRALETARLAERQLRLVTENTTDMISVLAPDLTRLWVSSAAERLLGFSPADLVGRPVPELVHAEDRVAYVAAVRRAFAEGSGSVVYRHRRAGGEFAWMEVLFRRVDAAGEPELIAVNRDVTARRLAEDAARRAQEQASERERLLSMAETLAKVGYWRLEANSGAVTWSPEIFRLYGLDPAADPPSLAGALAAIHPDDQPDVTEMLATSLETGAPYAVTMRVLRPDGSQRWARSVAQRDTVDGRVVGLFGVVLDVSEEGEALAAAERALAARTAFAATINHEIRTPLASMLAAAEMLRGADHAERSHYLDIVARAGRHLARIVDDVLLLSRLESGAAMDAGAPFDLTTMLDDLVAVLSTQARAKGLTLAADRPDRPLLVSGHATHLARVLTNLLANAIKFTPRGGVTLAAAPPDTGDLWRFTVTDTGAGIAPERHDAIFEPYVQADATVGREHGGTGLGLAICKLLIERMGGRIGVESEPACGATFWIELPLPQAGDRPPDSSEDRAAALPLRLLLAEDNVTNRSLITALLRRAGHDVVAVGDGAAALAAVRAAGADPFDAVLLDVRMPGIDGITAAGMLRATAAMPLVALTADLFLEENFDGADTPFDAVLSKPVDIDQLGEILSELVRVPTFNAAVADPHIEDTRIALLRRGLGEAEFVDTIARIRADASDLPRRIRAAAVRGLDHTDLAHELRGCVAALGCAPLVETLRLIELAEDAVPLLERLDRQAAAVVIACDALLPPGSALAQRTAEG